jgi:6-pyruvoyltetrahydropterin/6-carboxytetrahydropterin synthase
MVDERLPSHLWLARMSFVPLPSTTRPADAALPPAAEQWRVIKSYGHGEGLSCCFRQWQATHSHCRFLHGYALGFRFTFVTDTLDDRGWCVDFGGLKPLRTWLHALFDHTLVVAADDPELPAFQALHASGLAQLRVLPAVGCEAFAACAHEWASRFLEAETAGRVRVELVEVSEHEGNSASYGRTRG